MTRSSPRRWWIALVTVLLLGLALRARGIHAPILDHPGWRQGDEAAIARNFATLDMNPLRPQTDYDGPPPNYVELELQIVPWLAALGYKAFGVHPSFGRIISIAFSLGTVAVVGSFARALFASEVAGIVAALAFAIFPGSVYYGRTFTPDTTMTFFLTVALYAAWAWIARGARADRRFALAGLAMAVAILAKPVALLGLVPVAAMFAANPRTLRSPAAYGYVLVAIAPYAAYDAQLARIAEWHWASGITRLHVLPGLRAAFASGAGFALKLRLFRAALGMLATTMLGPVGIALGVLGVLVAPTMGRGARALMWGWLVAALAYAYVVVTVERVDYYLYPFLPLAALGIGGLASVVAARLRTPALLATVTALAAVVAVVALVTGVRASAPYYRYSKGVYRSAVALDRTLAPNALIVMGHYDPSVLYYIGRKGWEEDPYAWTPFDEQSAIRKGARYFVAVEPRRLARNVELAAWLERFPLLAGSGSRWPTYVTDPAHVLAGSEARWRAFRSRERKGTIPPQKSGDI